MTTHTKKIIAFGMAAAMALGTLVGCGGSKRSENAANVSSESSSGGEKVLKFGCQMFADGSIDVARDVNSAWNAMRYGITESLF